MELVKNGFTSQCFGVIHTARHLFTRAIRSPVLLVYLIMDTIAASIQNGYSGFFSTLVNLVILGASAVLIRQMTAGGGTMPLPVKRPKIELFTGLAAFLLQLLLICLAWRLTNIPVLQPGIDRLIQILNKAANFLCGNGPLHWASNSIGNAFVTTVIELIPALLLFSIFEYIPYGIGSRPYGKLTVVLLAVTVLSGLSKMRSTPLRYEFLLQTLVLFVIEIFISGLPEELFFRGFLLPRLERAFKDPVTALVLSALLFSAFHIPSHLAHGESWSFALLNVSLLCPSGLLLGYLYQRTRSIIPGVLLHTANNVIGFYFFNL